MKLENVYTISFLSQTTRQRTYHLENFRIQAMSTSENTSNTNTSSPGWCFICNISLSPETANEHYESRTHLNRCLQKGIGISVVPSSERSSSWCSICNHALENTSAEQHYQSRAHLNKCLQKGVGIPLSYATSAAIIPPAAPRFTQAGVPTSPQGGATGCFPSGGFTSFRPGPCLGINLNK